MINRFEATKRVSIPLTSDGGAVSVGAFTGSRIYGGTETVSGNGTLTVTLEPSAAYVYEITPTEAVDFTSLNTTKFHDLGAYSFAGAHIRHLENDYSVEGTSRNAFSPGANITARDAAEMIEKVLGYTTAVTAPYAEVQKTDFYANIRAALIEDGKTAEEADTAIGAVQTAVQAQITAGNLSAGTTLTRVEAAFILSELVA